MTQRRVLVHADRASLAEAVADRFITTVTAVLGAKDEAHVVLTGGTLGIDILARVSASPRVGAVAWRRVHFWWGDERWLPADDPERNDKQARDALLSSLELDDSHVHPFAASDAGLSLDEAADRYAEELSAAAADGAQLPAFDVVFLGVGPDGHIASLFPDREGIRVNDRMVVPVRNSPKPPPERLSLTLPAINSGELVWLALAGADKASPLGLALARANTLEVPAAGADGERRTVYFIDSEAAAEVPQDLIASEY